MDRVLHRNSVLVLAGIFLLALPAFWPNYFSRLLDQSTWRFHFHGLTTIAWCALMVAQAYLIRANHRAAHKSLGKLSYVLAPAIVLSILLLAHYQYSPNGITEGMLYFTALPIALALQFAAAYGFAIYHRRNAPVHARFMVCTALPMLPAILDRVNSFYLIPPDRARFLPQIAGEPQYWLISWGIIDAFLVVMAVWDWRSRRRLNVFPVLFLVFVSLEVLTATIYQTPAWISFTQWFFSLPLS